MGDLDANTDTPDATFVRDRLASLTPDSVPIYGEWQSQWNGYTHGTAVASVAVSGNPVARMVQHFRTNKARVVNMSWMRPEYGFVSELERCAPRRRFSSLQRLGTAARTRSSTTLRFVSIYRIC